jgi:hypothetical protein
MIGRLANGLAAALGAAVFAQFPEFYQQYLQRLGGRLDQARLDVARIAQDAAILGRSVQAYIEELLASGTEAARLAARRELARLDSADQLQGAYAALRDAGPLERPIALLRHLDGGVARETLRVFEPAVPVTIEGLLYGAAGLVAGLLLLSLGERASRGLLAAGRRRFGKHNSKQTHA